MHTWAGIDGKKVDNPEKNVAWGGKRTYNRKGKLK
jgi:hypothetical protein